MPNHRPRTSTEEDRLTPFKRMLERSPYFLAALLGHIVLFLMVATWVIFQAPPPKIEASFQGVKVALPPPPPPTPPATSGGAAANALDPAPVVAPPPSLSSVVQTTSPQNFSVDAVKLPQLKLTSIQHESGTALSNSGSSGSGSGSGSAFGSFSGSGTDLTGYFYDLKQTPDHKPNAMNEDTEQKVLREFFRGGWNEDDFAAKYLRSKVPLSTNQILVPIQLSATGPKAFHMDSECRPGYWGVIYHVKFTPSRAGNYRVAGFGDDFLVVRINGDIALDSGYYPPVTSFHASSIIPPTWYDKFAPNRPAWQKNYGQLAVGSSFRVSPGDTLSIDVFLGDANDQNGSGLCGYFLFLLEDGKDYEKNPEGIPILPLFQIQPESVERTGKFPPYTANPDDALTHS